MVSRLTDIESDLKFRREHAQSEGWIGEIEGIDLTLTFLRSKRSSTERLSTRATA